MVPPLISIIIPVFNSGLYIKQALESALNQTYPNIELLVINDGSTDSTEGIVTGFHDPRIRYFKQKRKGVSAARNNGLHNMKGDFFCFLDADDYLPAGSLQSRMDAFSDPEVKFVDGKVKVMNKTMTGVEREWTPKFKGNPLTDLARLTGKVFFSLTWLFRRDRERRYGFVEGLTHCEDLLFFMEEARLGGRYTYVEDTVHLYRNTPGSAMKNIAALEKGYRYIGKELEKWNRLSKSDLLIYKLKWRKFMLLDYIKRGRVADALRLVK